MWIIISIIGYAILAAVGILDKFILSDKKVAPKLFVFYSTIFVLPILLLLPFGVKMPNNFWLWFSAGVSGIFFAFGLYAMYKGFLESEISHIGPLVGGATPLFVLLLSWIFLNENLTPAQYLASVFLILGAFIIAFEKSQRHHGLHVGMLWGVLSGLLFAISHVASKYAYDNLGFYSGFVLTRSALGLCGLVLLYLPSIRHELFHSGRRVDGKDNVLLVVVNKILGVVGVVLIQYAIALGSVSVVNALGGLQYAILIVAVFLLSKFAPRIFKEQYTKAELWQEFLAILIIAVGLWFLI